MHVVELIMEGDDHARGLRTSTSVFRTSITTKSNQTQTP